MDPAEKPSGEQNPLTFSIEVKHSTTGMKDESFIRVGNSGLIVIYDHNKLTDYSEWRWHYLPEGKSTKQGHNDLKYSLIFASGLLHLINWLSNEDHLSQNQLPEFPPLLRATTNPDMAHFLTKLLGASNVNSANYDGRIFCRINMPQIRDSQPVMEKLKRLTNRSTLQNYYMKPAKTFIDYL